MNAAESSTKAGNWVEKKALESPEKVPLVLFNVSVKYTDDGDQESSVAIVCEYFTTWADA